MCNVLRWLSAIFSCLRLLRVYPRSRFGDNACFASDTVDTNGCLQLKIASVRVRTHWLYRLCSTVLLRCRRFGFLTIRVCIETSHRLDSFVLLICSPDPNFSHCATLDALLLLYALLCPMTFSPTVKTEVQSSIISTPLYLVTQQPYKHHRVDSRMADPSSSPPMRAKTEPMDSLSPSTSIELHERSKTGCVFAHRRRHLGQSLTCVQARLAGDEKRSVMRPGQAVSLSFPMWLRTG